MEKLIFRKFFKDTYFFIISILSLTLIVWVIQAVKFWILYPKMDTALDLFFLHPSKFSKKNIRKIRAFYVFYINFLYHYKV